MTPERLHQIEELYHAAKAKEPSARAAFLAGACAGDEALKREVESLLDQPDALAAAQTAVGPTVAVEPVSPSSSGRFFFEDLVGRHFGQFRIVGLLRDGGMARVYKGYQESVDRFVAIKVLPRQYANDPRFVERFKQEARIVAKLHHPHILSVFDHGESDGYTYLAMPFVETGTLADRIARGLVPFEETSRIIGQICEALDFAHAQGIVHRDIKPSNILMDAEGNAFVADFGIATILGNTLHLTQTGALLASPGYCSPEQLTGGEVGTHSDLYSVGMILYEMLTGSTPFHLDGSLASLLKRADSTLPALRVRNAGVTPQLEAVVVKALDPVKSNRYATGKDLAAAVAAAVRASDAKAPMPVAVRETPAPAASAKAMVDAPVAAPAKATRRGIATRTWVAAAIALVIVAALGITMLRRAEPQAPASTASSVPAAAPVAGTPEQPASPAPPAGVATAPAAAGDRSAPTNPPVANVARGAEPASAPSAPARDRTAPAPEIVKAKQLFTSADTGAPGLKYRLIEQRGTSEADADPARVFHAGDRVRFAFESNIDGFLYVVSAGSSGRWTLLFPNPDANGGRNAIARSEEYVVPDNGWFAFDDTPGTEELFVVLSKQPLDTLPGFKAPVTRRETVDRAVVTGLQAKLESRDMVFEKDSSKAADGKTRQATYVVNRGELASQVAALIQLNHAK